MNLQRHSLVIEDMEWQEELTDADLQAVVGGTGGTVDVVVEETTDSASEIGRNTSRVIDQVQEIGGTAGRAGAGLLRGLT
ncbi:hypothetical protein LC653_06295 [Nostoc sp. CHAB 5784]|uniref:Bacteriocin n=1 Tax=Nostoc favosum CHAB5714 TaxID=2780399 RepID=A0ABS8IDY3_9NOSO|nr:MULTISPECIES: hypothetical protein [Nostoc]MCC5602393.1 hypothetical protein [Nostoc favosum CHAB5714]MCC5663552.1 hypothetical protein [Nostoc mirabile CHAB5784]